ncbi:unnamed protein product, partial [Tetraodon nigroviridis]
EPGGLRGGQHQGVQQRQRRRPLQTRLHHHAGAPQPHHRGQVRQPPRPEGHPEPPVAGRGHALHRERHVPRHPVQPPRLPVPHDHRDADRKHGREVRRPARPQPRRHALHLLRGHLRPGVLWRDAPSRRVQLLRHGAPLQRPERPGAGGRHLHRRGLLPAAASHGLRQVPGEDDGSAGQGDQPAGGREEHPGGHPLRGDGAGRPAGSRLLLPASRPPLQLLGQVGGSGVRGLRQPAVPAVGEAAALLVGHAPPQDRLHALRQKRLHRLALGSVRLPLLCSRAGRHEHQGQIRGQMIQRGGRR